MRLQLGEHLDDPGAVDKEAFGKHVRQVVAHVRTGLSPIALSQHLDRMPIVFGWGYVRAFKGSTSSTAENATVTMRGRPNG